MVSAFPFPRTAYSFPKPSHTDPALCLPLAGVTASYLVQMVPCDVLCAGQHHPDFVPLLLFAELFSRNEGPLFQLIRGQGFAYDAGLSVYLWNGQMVFEVVDASEPVLALEAWWGILEQWRGKERWESDLGNFTDFEMETALACVLYRLCAETSTAGGVVGESLKVALRVRFLFSMIL
jgi:Zn-dependent M16 (insulinase) family peptidase